MPKSFRDISRRDVVKAAGGVVVSVPVGGILVDSVVAQDSSVDLDSGRQLLNSAEFALVEALAEQFWPSTDSIVGGRDAGAAIYIDRSLAGAYSQYRTIYQTGLKKIDQAARDRNDADFVDLDAQQQFDLITAIFAGEFDTPEEVEASAQATPFPVVSDSESSPTQSVVAGMEGPYTATLSAFLSVVRNHTMEGLFSDPVHGGNRGFAGWQAIGYPGPYVVYSEEQQQSFEELGLPFKSVADY